MRALRLLVCALLFALSAADRPQDPGAPMFLTLDVFVDSGTAALGAWQLELAATTAVLVGVEGGEATAFAEAPRYDPAALQGRRVILAALAQGDELPTGRTRVARVHLMEPAAKRGAYTLRGITAVSSNGERINADASVVPQGNK
jgi:hypothetical protein